MVPPLAQTPLSCVVSPSDVMHSLPPVRYLTKDVPDYGLMMGNPARQQGWMSRHGHRLKNPDKDGIMVCPESGYRYCVILDTHNMERQDAKNSLVPTGSERLRCLDLDEQSPLPSPLSCGAKSYDGFKLKH